MNPLLMVLTSLIVAPLTFFIGYKLRSFVPQHKRFGVSFAVAAVILTLLLALDFFTPLRASETGLGTAIAIGFPLGLAGPPFVKKS